MRYFFFSASYNTGSLLGTQNFGLYSSGFPSNSILKEKVMQNIKGSFNIVVLSVCEMTEDDYNNFWEI